MSKKKNALVVVVIIVLVASVLSAQLRSRDADPGTHQIDRDMVTDQAPLDAPSPPRPPAGRTGDEP